MTVQMTGKIFKIVSIVYVVSMVLLWQESYELLRWITGIYALAPLNALLHT